ncbi:alpha crystallin/HSP20 domain-containing protein [Tanacetum coccineum]
MIDFKLLFISYDIVYQAIHTSSDIVYQAIHTSSDIVYQAIHTSPDIVLPHRITTSANKLFNKLLFPVRSVSVATPSVQRGFNTNTSQVEAYDDFNKTVEEDRRHENNSYVARETRMGRKDDDEALSLVSDMPGLDKDNVKISVEQNTLVIKGEAEKESGEDEQSVQRRRYSSRIDLPMEVYKLNEIQAEMRLGPLSFSLLKLVVPKVKSEERKDVWEVQVK